MKNTKVDPDVTYTSAQRAAEVVRLRRRRVSFEDIGAQFGITRQRAHQIYWTTVKAIPMPEVQALRQEQREILEDLIDRAYQIASRNHLVVSHGKVVRMGEPVLDEDGEPIIDQDAGEPLLDDMPKLSAIARIESLINSMAALLGTRVPVKQLVEGDTTVKYIIEGAGLENLT